MKSMRKYWFLGVAAIVIGAAMPALANVVTGLQTAPTTVAGQLAVTLHIHFKQTPSNIGSAISCVITIAPSNDSYLQNTSQTGSVVQTTNASRGDCTAAIPFEWHIQGSSDPFNAIVTYSLKSNDAGFRSATGTAAFFSMPIAGGTGSVSANVGF